MPFPEAFGVGTIRRFTLSSSLFVVTYQCTLTRDIQFRRPARPDHDHQPIITFSFRNVVRAGLTETMPDQTLHPPAYQPPSVQVSSSDFALDLFFPARSQVNTIIIGIHVTLLNQLMGQQGQTPLIRRLLEAHHPYLYEEISSLAVQQIATELITQHTTSPLPTFYLTIKVQELIYQFFLELLKRETKAVYPLRDQEVKTLFRVRDQLVMQLNQVPSIPHLARLAGMSESKLRRLFGQVFGMSLYAYYQTVRMHEAARLLRETRLSVSETGYQLGFTNLSHFTRVFEQHLGQKPRHYAKSN
ncbi:hypothetical protein BH09BAC4_BH09BAC4_52170 [soil metagenome]